MKKHKGFKALFLCLIICIVFTFIGCRGGAALSNTEVSTTETAADIKTSKFSMHFIDVGRILRTFKIKKNVEVTDNGKIII